MANIKEFKFKHPEGWYFVITMPPGTTPDAAKAYAKAHLPQAPGPLDPAPTVYAPGTEPGGIFTSPKGFLGPGILSNLGAMIQRGTKGKAAESPSQVYDRSLPAFKNMADLFLTLAAPQRTLIQRLLSGSAVPAAVSALGGEGLGNIGESAGKGAGSQAIAEILSGVVKAGRLSSLAKTAMADFEQKTAAQAGKISHDKALLKTLEEIDKQNYDKLLAKTELEHGQMTQKLKDEFTQKMGTHEDLMAGTIMDEAKKSVPAWKDIPSTVAGLYTAVLGKGKELLSEAFDQALQLAKGTARGKSVEIPVKDAQALGVPVVGVSNRARQTSTIRDASGADDLRLLVPVDAAELIDKLPGLKDKALKARAHSALAEADLGIAPEAMREYQVGKGTIESVDEAKIFKRKEGSNDFTVDPEALATSLTSRKKMDTLQNREMGNWDTNPGLQVAKDRPLMPEIPPMVVPEPPAQRGPLGNPPPIPNPEEIGAIQGPHIPGTVQQRRGVTTALGAILGGLMGGHGGPGLGHAIGGSAGAAVGYGVGSAIPNRLITKAPMGEVESLIHQMAPALLGSGIREMTPDTASADPMTNLSPQDMEAIAEIIAAKAQGQTAVENPNLQLQINPQE